MPQPQHPDTYATTPEGQVLIADGLNPMKIWNGLRASPIDAGLDAPDEACVLAAGAAAGDIYGNYAAYVRYVKDDGTLSNLSPLSARVDVQKAGGSVTGATNADPIEITTSGAHGLTSGDIVNIQSVQGNTAANGTWEVTVTSATTFQLDTSSADGEYTTGGSWTSGCGSIEYTDVPVPVDPYVARKQILRNLDGQFTVFYVDVDTDDLAETAFTSNNSDNELATNTAVPLLSTDGAILAEAHERPPNFMTALCFHNDRMFAAVNAIYDEGAATVTNASATVTGIGTQWTAAMAGRYLYVDGATKAYTIESVNVATQTITLTEAYDDTTDPYATYAIRPEDGQRRLVWYTPAGQPQSWSATYAIQIQEDGDELTGLMAKGSFVYIIEYRHIYRFTFQADPAVDGSIYQSCQRGCINDRCWIHVESNTLMLDQDGVHAFGGGQESQPLSTDIQVLFQPIDRRLLRDDLAINWAARKLFHAAHFPHEEVARWFVAMGSNIAPKHALCYSTRSQKWWVEAYPVAVSSSALAVVNFGRVVFCGSGARQTLAMSQGHIDGLDPRSGTTYGTLTAADLCSLSDGSAVFPSSLAGKTVTLTTGRGKLQTRTIHAASSGRLSLTQPWSIIPEVGDRYQIGGVPYRYVSAEFGWSYGEMETKRRIAVSFLPTTHPATMFIKMYHDQDDDPIVWAQSTIGSDYEGVGAKKGFPELSLDLTHPSAQAQQRLPNRREDNTRGPRSMTFEFAGAAGPDGVIISDIELDGVEGG